MDTNTLTRLTRVEAELNYLADSSEKPVTYTYTPPSGTPKRTGQFIHHTHPVYAGRPLLDQLSLDGEGFRLIHHDSKVVNFYDADEVRRVYYPEVEQLVKEVTGAEKVVVFDQNVRCALMAKRGENNAQMPGEGGFLWVVVRWMSAL